MKVVPTSRNNKTIVLTVGAAPGDALMLSRVARDLKEQYPQFDVVIQTNVPDLFKHNPYCTTIGLRDKKPLGVHVPFNYKAAITRSTVTGIHFVHAAHHILAERGIHVPVRGVRPEVYLSDEEKAWRPCPEPYWVIVCGGKTDFTVKWWHPGHAQRVVDHFLGEMKFVQVGETNKDPGAYPQHVHFPLNNVVNMIGKTTIRQLISTIYNSEGVICPITFPMHLAAAVPRRSTLDRFKPCIVTAGGREPVSWEAYPGHQYLHSIGELPCCYTGPCWARRAQPISDQRAGRSHNCKMPIQVHDNLRLAKCMVDISAERVIDLVRRYNEYRNPLTILSPESPTLEYLEVK